VALNAVDAHGTLVLAAVVDITRRKLAEDAVRLAHAELEERVRDRTMELQAANQELEAFSYSVSHDLRAPLRAIDGFSRILLAEFAQSIPPEAQEYLHDVRRNTQKMGQLVDDLLAFSRLGRQPVNLQQVSVFKLVAQCVQELAAINEQPVGVNIAQLPDCQADPALLKQVWINLLSNAMKYSARRESPQVEVGCRAGDQPGLWTYFVKDNGVGFDMRYADKLFGVFQRLHRAEEYDGTGVGLAIVKRIVTRHGGTIWADAEPGRGAAFYFTLNMGVPDDDGQRSGDSAGRGQSERSEVGVACVSHA
jgi:light-regulated signal transduction histidine kinase (bacteriophytochrome)